MGFINHAPELLPPRLLGDKTELLEARNKPGYKGHAIDIDLVPTTHQRYRDSTLSLARQRAFVYSRRTAEGQHGALCCSLRSPSAGR